MTSKAAENGTVEIIDGKECVFYDGYWIRFYPVPEDTLANRKLLIDSLTRRAFHHTESGINTPGDRLEEARAAYEAETDPSRRRVNGAMLAGALFNPAVRTSKLLGSCRTLAALKGRLCADRISAACGDGRVHAPRAAEQYRLQGERRHPCGSSSLSVPPCSRPSQPT